MVFELIASATPAALDALPEMAQPCSRPITPLNCLHLRLEREGSWQETTRSRIIRMTVTASAQSAGMPQKIIPKNHHGDVRF